MPILFGTIASSNQQARADTGVMFPLGAVTVGATSSNQIVFSSIPQTYTHLQIRYIARTSSTNPEGFILTFNSDNSGSYGFGNHRIEGSGTAASSANGGGSPYTAMYLNAVPPTNSTASTYSAGVVDILDYANTNKNKVVRGLGGYDANGSGYISLASGAYFKTDAITRIDFSITSGANFLVNSQIALYGIKGA
jgi:hypothetical protein